MLALVRVTSSRESYKIAQLASGRSAGEGLITVFRGGSLADRGR